MGEIIRLRSGDACRSRSQRSIRSPHACSRVCALLTIRGAIGFQRIAGSCDGEITRAARCPLLPLAAHLPISARHDAHGSSGRPRPLNGLQLLDIPDQHDLRAGFGSMDSTRCQLAVCPTMPASSITSTSRVVSRSRPLASYGSMLAMVRDAMPDPLSRFSAAMPAASPGPS